MKHDIQLTLSHNEIDIMRELLHSSSDPFYTVKEAKSRVFRTKQSIADLTRQLKQDEFVLETISTRDSIIEKLKDKLGVSDE